MFGVLYKVADIPFLGAYKMKIVVSSRMNFSLALHACSLVTAADLASVSNDTKDLLELFSNWQTIKPKKIISLSRSAHETRGLKLNWPFP